MSSEEQAWRSRIAEILGEANLLQPVGEIECSANIAQPPGNYRFPWISYDSQEKFRGARISERLPKIWTVEQSELVALEWVALK